MEVSNEFSGLKWPSRLLIFEYLLDMIEKKIRILDRRPIKQELLRTLITLWAQISKECFQDIANFMTRKR